MKFKSGVVVIAGLCALAWVSTAAFGGASLGEGGGRVAALAAMVRDPFSLFAIRSPGERGAAVLNSKPARIADAGAEAPPTERVLSTVRERPSPVYPLEAAGPSEFAAPGLPFGDEIFRAGDVLQMPALGPEPEPTVIGGWRSPPTLGAGGGYLGGGSGGDGIDETQPADPSPVPEPATWAIMILGFFAIGASIRRGGAARARLKARAVEQA